MRAAGVFLWAALHFTEPRRHFPEGYVGWDPTDREILETFPDCKPDVHRLLAEYSKTVLDMLFKGAYLYEKLPDRYGAVLNQLGFWKILGWHRLQIDRLQRLLDSERRVDMSISVESARKTPIDSLVRFDRHGVSRCVFHKDNRPSMKLYRDNHVYCFSCKKSGDAISVTRAIRNCSFKEAVDYLCGQSPQS